MIERTIKAHLVVDYKRGSVKVFARPPRDVSGNSVAIKLTITLALPENKPHELAAKITLSETTVARIALEELAR